MGETFFEQPLPQTPDVVAPLVDGTAKVDVLCVASLLSKLPNAGALSDGSVAKELFRPENRKVLINIRNQTYFQCPHIPVAGSDFFIDAAALAFRVNRTAVRLFTPDGDALLPAFFIGLHEGVVGCVVVFFDPSS